MIKRRLTTVIVMSRSMCFTLLLLSSTVSRSQTSEVMPSFFGRDADGSKGEKVFVHTDKNSYLAGETVWFKLYTVDADNHKATPLSRLAYVEIYNSAARAVWQARVELREGLGWGSYTLPPSLASGTYVLRAYTNFMKNFDVHYFFQKIHKSFAIIYKTFVKYQVLAAF